MNDGSERKIEIPLAAKVTFGPGIPNPSARAAYSGAGTEYCLRIYTGSEKSGLLAVIAGIRDFRDVTIPMHKLVVREAGTAVWKSDETGYKREEEVKYEKILVPEGRQLTEG